MTVSNSTGTPLFKLVLSEYSGGETSLRWFPLVEKIRENIKNSFFHLKVAKNLNFKKLPEQYPLI
jgi:hypothetical protein